MKRPRILVVYRRSVHPYSASRGRSGRVTSLIDERDPLVSNVVEAHENHRRSMEILKNEMKARRLTAVWRHNISRINVDDFDLVITVGGDGTVLHASHSIGNTPVLALNSSPSTSAGFLTVAAAGRFGETIDKLQGGKLDAMRLCRMEVRVNGEVVTTRALNDVLFCHDCPASTTKYVIEHGDKREDQLSSGVWISTAAGSTAAIRAAGGVVMPLRSGRLQFVVREPFSSIHGKKRGKPGIVRGFVNNGKTLAIRSKTEAARLYVDGPHVDFQVDFGDEVTFCQSKEPLNMLGYNPGR